MHDSTINVRSIHSKVFRDRLKSAESFLYVSAFIAAMVLFLRYAGTGWTVPTRGN